MKILQVITSLLTGGAEKIVVELSVRLVKQGHQVAIALFDGEQTDLLDLLDRYNLGLKEQGLNVIMVYKLSNMPRFYNPIYIWKLHHIMKSYDIIHTHNSSPQLFAIIANIGLGKRMFTTEHNTFNRKRQWRFWKLIDKWMYLRYDEIVCISNQAYENLISYLPQVKNKAITIFNGIDVGKIHLVSTTSIQHPKDKFLILMIAAFRKQKDFDTLLKTIALLPQQYILWLAGDGKLRCKYEQQVSVMGLENRVCFLGNRRDVPELLHTADVICMSTHYEGLSLSNIEGMCANKPFVASDVEGIHEVTAGAGILFPHQDAKALATILQRLHDDKEYYEHTAEACYQRALKYDIHVMVRQYEQEYRKIIRNKDEEAKR